MASFVDSRLALSLTARFSFLILGKVRLATNDVASRSFRIGNHCSLLEER